MKLVIFDLDDTLIDFASTRQAAHSCMAEVLKREGIDAQAFLRACTEVDRPLFSLFEQGRITRSEYRKRRFAEPFDRLNLSPRDGLVAHLNDVFMDCVNDSPLLYDDVWPVLKGLKSQGILTAILTNGPSDGQRRKLKASGLGDAMNHIAIGEEIGVSKPLPQAFQSVMGQFDLGGSEVLMVGDSPLLDYDGAVSAGLNALLLDRLGSSGDTHRATIRSLHDISLPLAGRTPQ